MTPDERQMIEDLFQRLSDNASGLAKDREADRLINDLVRRYPDAAYMLVQTTLVYEHQMNALQGRIGELEDELAQRDRGPAQTSGGSFLGGRIGSASPGYAGSDNRGIDNRGTIGSQRGSVPPVPGPSAPASPWGHQQPDRNQRSAGFSGYDQPAQGRGGMFGGQPPMQPHQQPAQGGGFLRSALATAAGVAGGMMIANSLGGLFGGNSAQAADQSSAMSDADRTQDELQDAQFEADQQQDELQDATFDSGGGDFDSFET